MKILVAHGVNLDLLGKREPHIYGSMTLAELETRLAADAPKIAAAAGVAAVALDFFQTNVESDYLHALGRGYDGALLNPGAWTHTSLALADRLAALGLPFAEVHLSNISAREDYRKQSFSSPHARGVVYGFGYGSYAAGLLGLLIRLKTGP